MSEDEGKKTTAYRVEYASSGRAKCKGPKPCAGSVISKGVLRLGTPVTFAGKTSMAWRHWGCVTPKILSNFRSSFSEVDELDGYEELKKADKERVSAAWEAGHVADEDVPETAKKGAVDDDDEGDKKKDAKRKPKAKKAKKDEDDGDEADAPKKKAPKKAPVAKEKAPKKKVVKKKKASESEGENFDDEIEKVSDEEDEPEDEEVENGKKRKRPASKKETEASKPKKSRAKKPKKKTESDEEDDD